MAGTYIIGSEKLPVQVQNNFAQEPFSGTSTMTKNFTNYQSEIVVSNDGESSIYVKINEAVFEVYGGEVFNETFAPFKTCVIVSEGVPFRGYGKGETDAVALTTQYLATQGNTFVAGSNTIAYKGSSFTMNTTKALDKVGFWGNPVSWELWTANANTLDAKVASGTFAVEKDFEGYRLGEVVDEVILEVGKTYVLFAQFTSNEYRYNWVEGTSGYVVGDTLTNNEFITTNKYSYQQSTAPVTGGTQYTVNFVYDIKLVLEV